MNHEHFLAIKWMHSLQLGYLFFLTMVSKLAMANNWKSSKTISVTPVASALPHSSLDCSRCDICMFQHISLNIFLGSKKTTEDTIYRWWKDKPLSGLHGRSNGLPCGPGQSILLCFAFRHCRWLGCLVHNSGRETHIIIPGLPYLLQGFG